MHAPRYFNAGLAFLRENPQLFSTALLLVFLPALFLFESWWFLSVAYENQERVERERVGMAQDALALALARADAEEAAAITASFARGNTDVAEVSLLENTPEGYRVIASSKTDSAKQLEESYARFMGVTALDPSRSFIFQSEQEGVRHWVAYRRLPDAGRGERYLVVDLSMASLDAAARRNIRTSYGLLLLLLAALVLVVVRHARLIDYTALYKTLARVNRAKDEFVSIAAHELRTPLAAMRGYGELLEEADNLTPQQREAVKRIRSSAEQLNTLIGDMLDVAKLQTGSLTFARDRVAICPLAGEVASELAPMAERKGLVMRKHCRGNPVIRADRVRLKQVIVNLLGNAVKYTPQGTVALEVERDGAYAIIAVRDSGVGIAAEDQEKLFEKFYRVRREETKNVRGTGLGLWITKKMTEAMGGTIHVESVLGQGSRFYVRFPCELE